MIKKKIASLLCVAATFLVACAGFPFGGKKMITIDKACLAENIDRIAQYDLDNHKVFGSAYFVYCQGDSYEKCYGTTSLTSNEAITDTTLFRLASMTKPITAVATLILMERGLLSLEDSVDKFLPEFKGVKIKTASGEESVPHSLPTIKNILTHTSGIGSDAEKLAEMRDEDNATLDSAIAFYVKSGLDFEPGSMQAYSGTGAFDVLTKIIEKVTGEDYLRFLEREIFVPCDMRDTTFLPTEEQQQRMVAMHNRVNGENAVVEMPKGCIFGNVPSTHYLGGAGLVSTLRDYCNFAKMLLNKGKTNNGAILREESVALLSSAQVSKEIMLGSTRWGLGVRVIVDRSNPDLPQGCFGWSGAYGSHFWIDPENDIFAVYMKNSHYDGGAGNESANKFEEAVYHSSVR